MKFRPLHDRVVIRRVDPEGKTTGGIFIPDTAQEKPMEGEVVAVGPGARDDRGTVVRLRGQARWRGPPDHERSGHHGRHRHLIRRHDRRRQEEGRLTSTGGKRPGIKHKEQEAWQQKKYVLAVTPAPA